MASIRVPFWRAFWSHTRGSGARLIVLYWAMVRSDDYRFELCRVLPGSACSPDTRHGGFQRNRYPARESLSFF
jgi:hypothetical protein